MNRYRELLRFPYVPSLIAVAFPARVGYAMIALDIFFKVERETKSIALAGLAIGLNSISGSLTAGIRGVIIDKYGQTKPIAYLITGYVTMIVALSFAHDKTILLLFALILGITAPPINLSVRPLWKSIVPASYLRTAYALDSSTMSFTSIFGPVIATSLSLSAHPQSALLVTAGCMALGGYGLAFSKVSRRWKPEIAEKKKSLFRHRSIQLLALEGSFIGFGWGLFDVAVPAFTTIERVQHLTAWILGAMSVANVIGGIVAGLVWRNRSALRSLKFAYTFWFLISLPLIFTYPGWSMAIAAFFLGLVGGAVQVFYLEVFELTRPKGFPTAALGWLWTIEGSFIALGSALGGWVSATFSPRICFMTTSLCLAVGWVILRLGSGILRDGDRIPSDSESTDALGDSASTNV